VRNLAHFFVFKNPKSKQWFSTSDPARKPGKRKMKKEEAGGAEPRLLEFYFL